MILRAKEVTLKCKASGAWQVSYKGPSGVYELREYGILPPGSTVQEFYEAASLLVLATSNLALPSLIEVLVIWEGEVK